MNKTYKLMKRNSCSFSVGTAFFMFTTSKCPFLETHSFLKCISFPTFFISFSGGYMANGGTDGTKGSIVSPDIPAGNYSLSFWYFLTNINSQLNVSLLTQSSQKQVWSLPSLPNVGNWTHVKLDLDSKTDYKVTQFFLLQNFPGCY